MGASGAPDWYKIQVSHEGITLAFKVGRNQIFTKSLLMFYFKKWVWKFNDHLDTGQYF